MSRTRSVLFPILALGLISTAACSGDSDDDKGTDDTGVVGDDDDDDVSNDQAVSIAFDAVVGSDMAMCGMAYTVGGQELELADARLFLSTVEVRVDGAWQPLVLDETDWQHEGIALLDFEDGSAGCADSGTSDLNDTLTGMAPAGTIDGVRFDVGVPFELNHVDSATAPAPLNAPGMFWTWQGGYKFVRVDYAVAGAERWNVHVGSTGCVSDAPVNAPEAECSAPNRATIELDLDLSVGVTVDLGALIAGADVTTNLVDTPPGCMSSPTEPDDCAPVFTNLGLDFATGFCADDCAGQAIFR
jgi:uncharacterized repeat protein (TIGR04052 family)